MIRGIRLLVATGLLLVLWSSLTAAPTDGKWRLTVTARDQQIDLVLLSLSEKEGKADIKIEATNPEANVFDGAEVTDIKQDKTSLTFTMKTKGPVFRVIAKLPDGDAKVIRGVILIGDRAVEPVVLERTRDKEVGTRKLEGADVLAELVKAEPAEQAKLFKQLQEKHPGSPLLVSAAQGILASSLRGDAKADVVKADFARLTNEAEQWGAPLVLAKQLELAGGLLKTKKFPELALEVAQGVQANLPRDASAQVSVNAITLLSNALKANKKDDEAKKLEPALSALLGKLDEEFEKTNIPFDVKAFAGRKGKSQRATVVELFTGSECPPCVAADVAFDASIKSFKPTEAIFLEYHLHIPRPDGLTNPATLARSDYYGDSIGGTPTFMIDGKEGPGIGGPRGAARGGYDELVNAVTKSVEVEEAARVSLTAKRDGDKVALEVKAEPTKASEKLKIRLVLVEDVVRYAGGNGQRLHHHVVREFLGGDKGLDVKADAQKVEFSVKEVAEKVTKYLDDFGPQKFATSLTPPEMKKLKVVAFVQNDESKAILNAVQVDIPEAK